MRRTSTTTKAKRFGLFASVKQIDRHIETYRLIANTIRGLGIQMYKPELVDQYPHHKIAVDKLPSIAEGTQTQIRAIDFAVAFFTEKSRLVFFQTITALENKLPVLCLVQTDQYENFPEALQTYGPDLVTVRKYDHSSEIGDILREFVDELEPLNRRFNVVLKTKTLKQMELLANKMEVSKAGLIRRLVDKEYQRTFGND